MKTPEGHIRASEAPRAAVVVKERLAAGIVDARAPETKLDQSARELREKLYAYAHDSLDGLMELLQSKEVALRTRTNGLLTIMKAAQRDAIEVAKLRLDRERLAQEAEMARLDRETKERIAERIAERDASRDRPASIVIVDADTIARAKLAAGEQDRIRGAGG